ncbi:tetratricopeptide repeat protein [Asticcacaulis machinosus]|uniref:Tetratricopeptide repeat protein n=1 Tax=Asticcacaulis machinosus TaxID=2984211 RepID=A0ABT5HFS2_9CAUL|nr:tetratricopeptide repeat protein [Asticcacaulis machinosus]MDC7675109.1 tetratricopeptide repeat protein [Asticcacaulis machinosus]
MIPDPLTDSIATGDWPKVEALARVRLSLKPDDTEARRYLALALERQNRLPEAFGTYQALLAHLPSPPPSDIVHDLARLAFRLDHMDMAEKLYRFVVHAEPDNVAAIAGLAASQRQQMKYDAAIDGLKIALDAHPETSELWNVLGTVVNAKNDPQTALTFFDEALRLDADNHQARFHRGIAHAELGDFNSSLNDLFACIDGFSDPSNIASVRLTTAQIALCAGKTDIAWPLYEARHKTGTAMEVHYPFTAPRWQTGQPLAGQRLFVSAEQGLGDEILFGTLIPDVIRDLGDEALLSLGVEPRLRSLFARSFPKAHVYAHRTRREDGRISRQFDDFIEAQTPIDQWALMADFCATYRPTPAQFPAHNAYLKADPARVSHWQNWLNRLDDRPKVGILWKSLKTDIIRERYYSPFDDWEILLRREDITVISLQYGDARAELDAAAARGLQIITPPDIDLKDDLDDLCALTCALDLTLGPANATTNIAAAAGARTWIITSPNNWVQMGERHYPWYPAATAFMPHDLSSWDEVMGRVDQALTNLISGPYRD